MILEAYLSIPSKESVAKSGAKALYLLNYNALISWALNTAFVEIQATDLVQTKRIIRQLALEWIQGHLPANELTFVDCLNTITQLQSAIQDIDRTEAIFDVVFLQATTLKKSSEWLASELQFEAVAQLAPNRKAFLLLYLSQSGVIDDDELDLYNERITRFANDK